MSRWIAFLALGVALSGCTSHPDVTFAGGDDDDDDDGSPLTVLFTSPANGDRDVAFDAPISVVFSKELDPATFTASTFSIALDGTDLAATISVNDHVATLTPALPFEYLRSYDVSLAPSLASIDSASLGTAQEISFEARDREWQLPHQLSSDLVEAGDLQLSFAETQGLATWSGLSATGDRLILASRYDLSTGWAAQTLVESTALVASQTLNPRSAVNSFGDAAVVWDENVGGNWSVMAKTFEAGVWSSAVPLATFTQSGSSAVEVAMDGLGNAVAVWSQEPDIFAAQFVAGSGWSAAFTLESAAGYASRPHVVVTPDGTATAVWWQDVGTDHFVWASSYVPGSGWSAPQQISLAITLSGSASPSLAVGAGGHVSATWLAFNSPTFETWIARLTPGAGWGAPQQVEQAQSPLDDLRSAVGPDGDVIVSWSRRNASLQYDVVAADCAPSGACDAGTLVGGGYSPEIAVDARGIALVLSTSSTGDVLRAARRHAFGWTQPNQIPDTGSAFQLRTALSPDGVGIGVWIDLDYSVWAADLR